MSPGKAFQAMYLPKRRTAFRNCTQQRWIGRGFLGFCMGSMMTLVTLVMLYTGEAPPGKARLTSRCCLSNCPITLVADFCATHVMIVSKRAMH